MLGMFDATEERAEDIEFVEDGMDAYYDPLEYDPW